MVLAEGVKMPAWIACAHEVGLGSLVSRQNMLNVPILLKPTLKSPKVWIDIPVFGCDETRLLLLLLLRRRATLYGNLEMVVVGKLTDLVSCLLAVP